MWKQVAPLFVVAVAIGWFMPAGDPAPETPAEETAKPDAKAEVINAATDIKRKPNLPNMPGMGSAVVLAKQSDGHYYADATANGQPLRLMVDTGASIVALTGADAQRMGLFWNQSELQTVGRGVSGDVTGKAIEIAELRIGGLSATNVKAVIIPDGLDVSLLGQSFLSQVGNVSISGDQMTLR
jgi:aspartyl protease family protein